MFLRFAVVALLAVLLPSTDALAQIANTPSADGVLGQPDFVTKTSGLSASTFNGPNGVAVDPLTGKLFVADRGNNRVLRFTSEAALQVGGAAEAVFGQDDFESRVSGSAANRLNNPIGIHVDASGRLWVADYSNNRVLRFDDASSKPTGASADGVLGQPDFTSSASAVTASGMRGPVTAFADSEGRVWVTEFSNHRITRFDDAASKPNGAAADGVLGQPDFTSGSSGLSATAFSSPNALYVDAEGRLYVSDNGNRRVLRFDAAASKADGAAADGVLGQPDFVTNTSNVTQDGMTALRFVYGDSDGRLFVIQENSHRITIYEDAATLANGAPADYVWGQPDFTSGSAATPPTAESFNTPRAIYIDDATHHAWIADYSNHRVLRFDLTPPEVSTLALLAPNGGESLVRGTTYAIQWSSQNVDNVGLAYSVDDGAAWTAIDTVAADAGQYDWSVPSSLTTTGRVRIYDVDDATLADTSAATFSIVEPSESVTLLSPNGYQRWGAGSTYKILFSTRDVSSVDLSYSLDDGQTWETIASGYAATSGAYSWTLPEAMTTEARIRITQAGVPSVFDESDAAFTIASEPFGHPQDLVFFSGSPVGGTLDASYAAATAPSTVANQGSKLPLSATFALVDNYAIRLSWMSAEGGSWSAAVASAGWVGRDITAKDSLEFRVFTETAVAMADLPVIFVEDLSNRRSPKLQLATYSEGWEANTWNRVVVPVSAFTGNAGTTDMTRVKTVFLGQNQADGVAQTVYLDDVRFSGGDIISGEDRPVIVVLGSSTAAGTGASSAATSWVGRYRTYVQSLDEDALVVNLAVGGYTTYDVMPTGFVPPSGRPAPKPNNNITYALVYEPTAIIVNLPSNDANIGVPVADQMANMRAIRDTAEAHGIPIWFTTTQPRNFADDARRDSLMAARDSILTQFAPQTIDFWTGVATSTGTIEPAYNSGDGIHLNDAGHALLFERVNAAEVWFPANVGTGETPASTFALDANYPNPVRGTTSIQFSLPSSTARATLEVFDLLGRRVADVLDQSLEAGLHTVQFDASTLSSGVYVYRLAAEGQTLVRRMTVVR